MTSDYGMYRLSFTPPADPCPDYPSIGIEMTTPGDASVDNMLRFFEAFLAAAGYVLKGELQVVEPEPERDFWATTVRGSQGVDFVPFSLADDVITFGAK